MKRKVRTPKQIKLKTKKQAARPKILDSIIKLPKMSAKKKEVKVIGSKLDNYEIESIKLV